MSNQDFTIKVGSNGDAVFFQFDPVIDLTGASVTFTMRLRDSATLVIDRAAAQVADGTYLIDGVSTVLVPADGVAIYGWPNPSDLATAGAFEVEWNAITSDGRSHKRPSFGYDGLIVSDDLPA